MAARETKKQHTEEKAVRKLKLRAAELTAIDKCLARLEEPSRRFRVSKHGSNWQIGFDHPDQLVGRALVMDHALQKLCFRQDRRIPDFSSSSRSIAWRSSSFDTVAVPIFITTIPPP